MTNGLASCEIDFEKDFRSIDMAGRQNAGALLSVIPDHVKWDAFLTTVKAEWQTWRSDLGRYPTCLVALYGGLAFYEYDENTFWPQFAKAIRSEPLPASQQSEINSAFSKAAEYLGLKLQKRANGINYVGSAVYHIGIPLSLWDGFLEICKWTLYRDDWKTLSDEEWAESVGKRTGGRQRLKKFLIDNREAASAFIQEMLDAREILTKDASLTVDDIAQASLLRIEYFDEAPETAEFLREKNPESLFQDRARLVWDEQRSCIILQLPAVAKDKLPAIWSIGELTQKAAATPDELILNSVAFNDSLVLKLESGQRTETQRLRGLKPRGLFDLESGGRLVNPRREILPLRNYALISQEKIEEISRKGFDEEENPVNEPIELKGKNSTTCFVTHLWPIGKSAELSLRHVGSLSEIRFKIKSKIEARFFIGRERRAANFTRIQDMMKVERLPILCVLIPSGYFIDNEAELNNKFKVFMDDRSACGHWERRPIDVDDDREFYFWKWSERPFQRFKPGTLRDFKQLSSLIESPDLKGERILSVEAPQFRIKYKIYLDHSKHGMEKCWKNLPGAFLPWFLLCQSDEGMKWEDLMLAKDVIAPNLRVSYYLLRKYADQGLLIQKGRRWVIKESRAVLKPVAGDKCQMEYCGNPSILWGLYRRMYHKTQDHQLPIIEIINKRGEIPYLQMIWNLSLRYEIEKYLKNNGVFIGDKLWIH